MYRNILDLQIPLDKLNSDDRLAVTAPFVDSSHALFGFYSLSVGGFALQLPLEELNPACQMLYVPRRFPLAVHGLKRVWEFLELSDADAESGLVYDVELMAYLLNPGLDDQRGYSLSYLSSEYLPPLYPQGAPVVADLEYPDALCMLLVQDAFRIHRLSERLESLMPSDLLELYRNVEVPLSFLLARMHLRGVGVDQEASLKELRCAEDRMAQLMQELGASDGTDLASPRGTYEFLSQRGIEFMNPSTSARGQITDEMLKESPGIPYRDEILEWRELNSSLSFLRQAADNSRLHPVWRQVRGSTGRIFSTRVPVQSLDKTKLRPLLKADPGHVLLKPDYSGFQLRLLAHLSKDERLSEIFRQGDDIHLVTGKWYGFKGTRKDIRNRAKPINFGICFGQGPDSLSEEMGTTREEAQAHIDRFFKMFPGAGRFFEDTVDHLKKQKDRSKRVIRSPHGRLRRFDRRFTDQEARKARVTPLQQVEADIVKKAMVEIDREFRRRAMRSEIVMMIHDSIWVESPESEAQQARELLQDMMTSVVELDVPLEVKFD